MTIISYVLGVKLSNGTVTNPIYPLEDFEYNLTAVTVYDDLETFNFQITPVWYGYDDILGEYTEVDDPQFTASIDTVTVSNGDPAVMLTVTPSSATIGGNFSNITYPGNDIRGVIHNGISSQYLSSNWGVQVRFNSVPNFYYMDTLTKLFLESGPKTVTYTVVLDGTLPGGVLASNTVSVTQVVNNLSLNSESIGDYVSQTYFGRKIFPFTDDGERNPVYFNGMIGGMPGSGSSDVVIDDNTEFPLVSGATRSIILDDFASLFNGIITTFQLRRNGVLVSPSTASQLIVVLGGVQQRPERDYFVAGSDIVFSEPPEENLECFIIAFV